MIVAAAADESADLVIGDAVGWVRMGAGSKSGSMVSSARLRDSQVTAFHSKLIADSGLDVQSPHAGSPAPVVAFIPLSPETAPGISGRFRAAAAKALAGS